MGSYGLGSAPPFTDRFVAYVGRLECKDPDCKECRETRARQRRYGRPRTHDEGRLRAKKAFDKLRRVAPREFDTLYMHCILGYDIPAITKAHNERAQRLGKPERYTQHGVMLLLLSGAHKVTEWW